MNIKRYIIDYTKFVTQRIPFELRFNDVISFLMAMVSPIVSIYNKLNLFRESIIYKLTITPQVVYLEKMLNDRYDANDRRIYIRDGSEYTARYLYRSLEAKPIVLYRKGEAGAPPLPLFTRGETGQFTFDFVVFVPSTIEFDNNEMQALVKTYKLASKLFAIQTF